MITPPPQRLRVLPGTFEIRHEPDADEAVGWLCLVRDADGVTVVRQAVDGEPWVALRSQVAHGLDVPGMLAALLVPLASAGVPVFVASTYAADIVLVPRDRQLDAVQALRAAGHEVVGP